MSVFGQTIHGVSIDRSTDPDGHASPLPRLWHLVNPVEGKVGAAVLGGARTHRLRQTSMAWFNNRPRDSKVRPADSYSSRCHPTPTPRSRRPPDRTSMVAAIFARTTGRRSAAIRMLVPKRTREVTAVKWAIVARGSSHAPSGPVGCRPPRSANGRVGAGLQILSEHHVVGEHQPIKTRSIRHSGEVDQEGPVPGIFGRERGQARGNLQRRADFTRGGPRIPSRPQPLLMEITLARSRRDVRACTPERPETPMGPHRVRCTSKSHDEQVGPGSGPFQNG